MARVGYTRCKYREGVHEGEGLVLSYMLAKSYRQFHPRINAGRLD